MSAKRFWGYVNTNYQWFSWLFVNKNPAVKLGPFETRYEAVTAAKDYESSN